MRHFEKEPEGPILVFRLFTFFGRSEHLLVPGLITYSTLGSSWHCLIFAQKQQMMTENRLKGKHALTGHVSGNYLLQIINISKLCKSMSYSL